jgi:disulfide bond formation protein DsbB
MLLCAVLLVIGSLAAIFEDAPVVRIYGGLTSVMAVIVGTAIARRLWPRKPVADTMN